MSSRQNSKSSNPLLHPVRRDFSCRRSRRLSRRRRRDTAPARTARAPRSARTRTRRGTQAATPSARAPRSGGSRSASGLGSTTRRASPRRRRSSRASASSSLFREKGSASFEKARVKKSELGFVCFVASVWARAFLYARELRSSPAWSSSARNSAAAALDAPSAGGGGERDSDRRRRVRRRGARSSARGRRRASAERQNPKHPRSSRFFPAGSETEDFVKCVAAYASNGSRASWTRSNPTRKRPAPAPELRRSARERRRVASRRSLSALFSSNPDVRPARSLNDSLIIKPGGTLSRLRSASSFALDTALGSARARSSAFVAFVRGHRGTSAPDFVAARARISRARLRARNPRARACSVVAARSSAAAAANGLCLSSAFSFPGSEGRPRSDIERRDDARRAGVGLRSETRGDGDGNAVGDEGLDETSDVFRDRVLVSGETDVVSATRLDSVATAMSVSANVRARTCSPYASLRSRADDDRRFRTSIFASVAGEGAAVPSAASRRGESVVAEGTEDTRGASARARLRARRPAPSPPPRASRLRGSWSPTPVCARASSATRKARVFRARSRRDSNRGRFSSARTSATPAGAPSGGARDSRPPRTFPTRVDRFRHRPFRRWKHFPAEGEEARPRRSTQKAPSTRSAWSPARRSTGGPSACSARRARRARFRFFFAPPRRRPARRPARRPIPFSSQPRPRRRRIVTLREKRRLPSRRATRASSRSQRPRRRGQSVARLPETFRDDVSRRRRRRRRVRIGVYGRAGAADRGIATGIASNDAVSCGVGGELSEAVPTTTRPFSGCSNTNHRWPCPSSGSSPHPAAPRAAWPRPVPTRARARELVVWERTLRRERPRRARHPARRTVTSAEWIQGRSLPARPNRDRRTFAERARRFTRGAGRCATRRAGRSSFCTDGDRARVVPVTRERRTAQPPLTASSKCRTTHHRT